MKLSALYVQLKKICSYRHGNCVCKTLGDFLKNISFTIFLLLRDFSNIQLEKLELMTFESRKS